MPYFTGGPAGPNPSAISLDDLPSSSSSALSAGVESAWDSNPSVLAHDWWTLRSANDGPRLDNATAQSAIQQSGVKLTLPEDGYTRAALDLLIQRKQDEARRQDILARAPTGFVPTTTRFAAQLATGLTDPLNIAASFIPVVGEARVASLLARAGDSLLARSAVRFGVGAAEGAVGIGAIEPFAYAAHQQLQDDYSMTDSLSNVAFGAAMGGTLHSVGGAFGDALRGGPHPAARFAGMSVDDIQTALNFERARATMPPEDQARVLQTFTPEMRRAVGAPDVAPVEPNDLSGSAGDEGGAPAATPRTFTPDVGGDFRNPLSAEGIASRIDPALHATAVRAAVADFAQGRTPDVSDLVHMDPEAVPAATGPAIDAAVAQLQAQRAELLGEAGNLAQRGVIRQTRQQLKEHLSQAPDTSDEALRGRAKEIQAGGRGSYKAALSAARKELDQRVADHEATASRLQGIIDSNARAQQAVQALHEIDQRIDDLIRSRPLIDVPPTTLADVHATAMRQAQPERISVGDFFAARAEEQRLKSAASDDRPSAPGDGGTPADSDLARATDALQATAKNLEQGGMAPSAVQAVLDGLKPYDDAIADSKNLGNALRAAALCGLRA